MGDWTIGQIKAKADSEGLDYMISDYLDADQIADPKLAELWRAAHDSLAAVSAYLEAHTVSEREPAKPTGIVSVDYCKLLCDSSPDVFVNAERDANDYPQLTSVHGGTLRLNEEAGRFGHNPEVYIRGSFGIEELFDWMRKIEPHVANHVHQSVGYDDSNGYHHTLPVRGVELRPDGYQL